MKRAIVSDELPAHLASTAHRVVCPTCQTARWCYAAHLFSACNERCGNCRSRSNA